MLIRLEGILPTCASAAFGTLFLALFAFAATSVPPDPVKTKPAFDLHLYQPVVLVTLGWNALYFCFLQGQGAAAFWVHKARREAAKKTDPPQRRLSGEGALSFTQVKYGKEFSSVNGGVIFTMDRTVGNMLEQSMPFLTSIWLHAFTASPATAAWFGWVWLLLRALYPIAFAHPSMSRSLWDLQRALGISWINFVTWPSYLVIWYLLVGAAGACW